MASNRADFVSPILLAILAYLASMITRSFQRSVSQNVYLKRKKLEIALNFTVADNFISNADFLQRLQNESLWDECADDVPQWWDGKSEPKNIWEELSKMIWQDRPEFQVAVGVEYWCNKISHGYLPWHIDKDEVALKENNKLITPIMGSVFYGFNHTGQFSGGKLLLVDADVYDDPLVYESTKSDEVVQVDPIFNRMLIFNATKWHRVTETLGSGARYTFAANVNSQKPKGGDNRRVA